MERKITVYGKGEVRILPDTVVLQMTLTAEGGTYERAAQRGTLKAEQLTQALTEAGLPTEDLKTGRYNVSPRYSYQEKKRRLLGYTCQHGLEITFPYDLEVLDTVMQAVAECGAEPQLSVNFKVADRKRLEGDVLRAAMADARRKAELLCAASDAQLGQILTIDERWNSTGATLARPRVLDAAMVPSGTGLAPQIKPDEEILSAELTCVWALEG